MEQKKSILTLLSIPRIMSPNVQWGIRQKVSIMMLALEVSTVEYKCFSSIQSTSGVHSCKNVWVMTNEYSSPCPQPHQYSTVY